MVDNNVEGFKTDSVSYLDLGVAYDFKDLFGGSLEGLTARISLTNVTDQDPEIIPARVQANTDPSAYDTLGRRYFVTFTYAFQ
jgi:outer membrane receptor protein involved in Fe transport